MKAAQAQTKAWRDDDHHHPHRSLDYQTPSEFAARCGASAPMRAEAAPRPTSALQPPNDPSGSAQTLPPTSHSPCYRKRGQAKGINIRPGDDFHIEWGFGKSLTPAWTIGLTAYTHWQVTNDTGSAVTYDASVHDRFFSAGPEILYLHAPAKLLFSTRYQAEFGAIDRTQGHTIVVSLVKIF